METRKVGRSFYQRYKKEDGSLFKGILGKPPLTGRYTNYVVNGFMLFTGPESNIKVGDVFFNRYNTPILVMDNADEESLGQTQKCFTLKIMNRKMKLYRQKKTIDPVSGVEGNDGEYEFICDFYSSFEDDGKTQDTLQIQFNKYRLITNKKLSPNDIIEDEWGVRYIITRSDIYVGVTVARVKKQ